MRIYDGSTKAISVILGYALAIVSGFLVGIAFAPSWGVIVGTAVLLVVIVALTRWFRGENESREPRAWWRMTARPTAGYVLAAWFFLQALTTGLSRGPHVVGAIWINVVVVFVIALAYLASSIRLGTEGRDRSRR
jgi:hypothetical protein